MPACAPGRFSRGRGLPLQVIAPSQGGPAEAAGIQPRETLVAINQQPTAGMSLYDIGDLLQGSEGTQVGPVPHRAVSQLAVWQAVAALKAQPVSWRGNHAGPACC